VKIGKGKRLYVAELNWLPIEEDAAELRSDSDDD